MRFPERLRIAMFTYATQPRGGVLHALALAEALYDLGHDVVLFALDDSGRGFTRVPRCPYVLVPLAAPRGEILPFVRACIDAYVAGWDPATPPFDVYHAHDGISGNALATLVERGLIPHYVRTVHHLDDFGAGELAALQDRSILLAGACLVVSRVWARRVARAYGFAATVVPNGVDSDRFYPVPAAVRARLREELGYGSGPLFVTIGGIEARKNSLAVLDAFARVRAMIPSARLVIAGGASIFTHSAYRRRFEERAAELGLSGDGAMVVAGVLSDDRIVALVRAAHALVFPSLIEGFGLVVLEALACATPVVTSAIAPFTEFLTPDDALLVDPHEPATIAGAMMRALDPNVAEQLALRGPALARHFSWRACARAHIRAYKSFRAARSEVAHA
jgi:glycosyltransferase-like protein